MNCFVVLCVFVVILRPVFTTDTENHRETQREDHNEQHAHH